ncbi:glutamyl-prolyl-tRNA synthetase, isoform CRA_a [Rattus norvegicus]|uniref:Glutamyl-prolyl-tRNA synthetase, isoform CRA_a n=1 Tax=Rattus norvegicus TaxID=10116 RepID=A6JGR4_RAT|nr:glutamyl-prolyl-tRNA synthetase, isoform CRA_a [Rattus norvegicus]
MTLAVAACGVESRLRCLRSRVHVASPSFLLNPVLRSRRGKQPDE